MPATFTELQHLFGSATALPQIADSPLRLAELLDSGDPSPAKIDDIVLNDPALTAGLIRAASSALYARQKQVTTVREAVSVLGFRSLKSLSIALWTNALMSCGRPGSLLDIHRFASNGNFVGSLASQLVTELHISPTDGEWSAEELLAAGALHNVLFGLLSYVAPDAFNDVYKLAESHNATLDQTFSMMFGYPISELAERAAFALALPEFFTKVCVASNATEPETTSHLCLQIAKQYAESTGHGLAPWSTTFTLADSSPFAEDHLADLASLASQRQGLLAA
ncbi:MAG: HDOD domain-containing protein [Fimbriimonadaceae bacterium]|nr:HDOD domain-containing protein [Fimbriimonadaceae bacterium]